ncbi:MAG: hypothetical protein CMQ01_02375, partial [Gammaproteobacteria bacterium]|nr:hypothetical protein [Gammaproteobacteria bacterium]
LALYKYVGNTDPWQTLEAGVLVVSYFRRNRLGRRGKSQSIKEFFSHLSNVALHLAGRTVLIIPGVAPIARTAQSQEEP